MPSSEQSDDGDGDRWWSRRRVLHSSAVTAVSAVAGCSSSSSRPTGSRPGTATTERSVETSTDGTTDDDGSGSNQSGLVGPWPTVHADSANTGSVAERGPRGSPAVHWRSGVRLETELTAAATPQGAVATQREGRVVAYDNDGRVRWRDAVDGSFVAGPVVGPDGTVVVGTGEGAVTAYDADGTVRWTATTPRGLFPPHANDATPFRVVDDRVVLAHPSGTAVAFALDDGDRAWETSVPRRCHRPALGDGRLVFASEGGAPSKTSTVFALDVDDGRKLWEREVEGSVGIGAGVADGVVYVGDIDGRLSALALADGTERWTVNVDQEASPWISTIPTAYAGRVWVGTLSSGVYAVTADGVQAHADVETPTTPAVGDGRLYVGSSAFGSDDGRANGAVLALDDEGETVWRTRTRGHPDGQVRYRDGRVVLGTDSGVLATFDAGDGSRSWRGFERPASLPSPVVGDGALYCGSRSDGVRGYTATDGESHLWYVGFDGMAPSTPVVAGDTVVAGSTDGGLAGTPRHEHADPPSEPMTRPERTTTTVHVDAPSPEPRWRIDLDGPIGDVGYGDGLAYVGSGDRVVGLTVDGDVRWNVDVGGPVSSAPAVVDDTLFVARDDGRLLALDTGDGAVQWETSVGASATAPVVGTENDPVLVLVGTDTGVTARDAADGTESWRRDVGRMHAPPAVRHDRAFAATSEGVVHALSLPDGTDTWTTDTSGAIHGAPAIAEDTLYVGTRNDTLAAIDVADGTVDWTVELADWVDGSPVVAYGTVFATTQAGTLTAVVADPD